MGQPEVLDTHILRQQGSFLLVRRWLRGKHPERGQLTWGYTGWETVEEKVIIRPIATFKVEE